MNMPTPDEKPGRVNQRTVGGALGPTCSKDGEALRAGLLSVGDG